MREALVYRRNKHGSAFSGRETLTARAVPYFATSNGRCVCDRSELILRLFSMSARRIIVSHCRKRGRGHCYCFQISVVILTCHPNPEAYGLTFLSCAFV